MFLLLSPYLFVPESEHFIFVGLYSFLCFTSYPSFNCIPVDFFWKHVKQNGLFTAPDCLQEIVSIV